MKSFKISIILYFIVTIITTINGEIQNKNVFSQNPKWKGKGKITIEQVLTIGSKDFVGNETYFFSHIHDLTCDKSNNLYVLDGRNLKILKFNKVGKYIRSYSFKKGQGPGDVVLPLMICVDSNENILIMDRSLKRITWLNKEGKVGRMIKLQSRPRCFALGRNNSIFVTYNSISNPKIQENHIEKIDVKTGKTIGWFGRETRDKSLLFDRLLPIQHTMVQIETDWDQNLYFAYFHPFEVRRYDHKNNLEIKFSRKNKYRPPKIRRGKSKYQTGLVLSIFNGISFFPDGKVLTLSRHDHTLDGKGLEYIFDIFSKEGKWLFSFNGKKLGITFVRAFTIDLNGNLYIDFINPYNHIKKFKIKFN